MKSSMMRSFWLKELLVVLKLMMTIRYVLTGKMSWSRRMNACISRRVNISTEPEAVRSADDNQGQREKTS